MLEGFPLYGWSDLSAFPRCVYRIASVNFTEVGATIGRAFRVVSAISSANCIRER